MRESIASANSTSWLKDADESAAYNRPPASNHPLEDVLRRIEMETAVELGAGDVTGPTTSKEAASEIDRSVLKRVAALGSQRPGNLLSRYKRDGQH